jgi:hypothetical protein
MAQRVTDATRCQRLLQPGPVPVRSGQSVVHVDPWRLDAQPPKSVPLRSQILFLRRDPRLADEQPCHDQLPKRGRPGTRSVSGGRNRSSRLDAVIVPTGMPC